MILLDLSIAFDSVSHTILLKKLQSLGVSPDALYHSLLAVFPNVNNKSELAKTHSPLKTVTGGYYRAQFCVCCLLICTFGTYLQCLTVQGWIL